MRSQDSGFLALRVQTGRYSVRLLLALLVLLILPLHAGAELVNHEISGTMLAFGDVLGLPPIHFSPDGQTVVYVADQQTNDLFDLYTPVDGKSVPEPLA
jgi:hypothetical protein